MRYIAFVDATKATTEKIQVSRTANKITATNSHVMESLVGV